MGTVEPSPSAAGCSRRRRSCLARRAPPAGRNFAPPSPRSGWRSCARRARSRSAASRRVATPGRVGIGTARCCSPPTAVGGGLVLGGELALVLYQPKPEVAGPSFPCAHVTAASARAICGDPDLAAWDRSVAQAFERTRAVADPATAVAEQKTWLVERDRCGAVKACLSKSLRERTDALMQQQ